MITLNISKNLNKNILIVKELDNIFRMIFNSCAESLSVYKNNLLKIDLSVYEKYIANLAGHTPA